jgi:hypothetical protein
MGGMKYVRDFRHKWIILKWILEKISGENENCVN